MKRVIPFTRIRYIMFGVSACLLLGGLVGTILQGGFNIGIDFRAGMSEQIQIAPRAMTVSYTGSNRVVLTMTGNSLTLTTHDAAGSRSTIYDYSKYPTLQSLQTALEKVKGLSVHLLVPANSPTNKLVGIANSETLSSSPFALNIANQNRNHYISIGQVRTALDPLGAPLIQSVGSPVNQQFIVRVEEKNTQQQTQNFERDTAAKIKSLIESKFGKGTLVEKQSAFIGPRFSQNLAQQTFTLTILALLLILVYVWFRFRLAYAVSAIIATIHDPLVMIGFIGVFQLEVNTATVAAVLTIIGYSLNDTIVVFDRIRENTGLMRDSEFSTIIDTSITQTLSRTIITSGTTQLAVISILVFATGSIQEFALNLTVGIVIGTYSSIFIASQVLLLWIRGRERRQRRRNAIKYGTRETVAVATAKAEGGSAAPEGEGGASGDTPRQEIAIPHVERKLKGGKRNRKKKK